MPDSQLGYYATVVYKNGRQSHHFTPRPHLGGLQLAVETFAERRSAIGQWNTPYYYESILFSVVIFECRFTLQTP